jgi:hypothetical protein
MVKLVVNESLPARLLDLDECAELCDSTGRIVGVFSPASEDWEYCVEPQVNDEELKRRAAQARANPELCFTTEQVKAHLESR